MNEPQPSQDACQRVRQYLDSYISSELPPDTNQEVLCHLEGCPACSSEQQTRLRLKRLMRSAVRQQTVPSSLEEKIRRTFRQKEYRPPAIPTPWSRWALAMAALVMVAFGGWFAARLGNPPRIEDLTRSQQDAYIQTTSARVAKVFGVGLGDHVHCAVFRRYAKEPPTAEQMAHEMGLDFRGLIPLAKGKVPAGYRVLLAHKCDYQGRNFVHLILKNDRSLVSLAVTRKGEAESFSKEDLVPARNQSGVAIYQAAAERFQVAGFESRDHLTFIVSDLSSENNLEMTAGLAPAVRDFLSRLEA